MVLLTKMNSNSARFAEQIPVTVRFAGQVGEILRDFPDDYTPEHRYAFYMEARARVRGTRGKVNIELYERFCWIRALMWMAPRIRLTLNAARSAAAD